MEFVSVFDPSFAAFGRLVPGYDTAALEQALFARRQPAKGLDLIHGLPEPRLRLTANALKKQLLGDAPANIILYSGRNTKPRRLLRARHGAFLFGAFDFLLLVTSKEEVSRRRIGPDQMTAFFVPGRVLIELYDTTLHCAPCHTHDRDGMNVLMILPCSTLRNKARQQKQLILRKIPVKLKVKQSEKAEKRSTQDALQHIPPAKKATEVRLVRPRIETDELGDSVSGKLRQGWTQVKELNARSVFGKVRWRSHIAAKLRKPPEDL